MRQVVTMLELADYLGIVRRRKWLILGCIVVGLVGAGVLFQVLPKAYTSTTLIVVENQKIPENYVRGVVAGNVSERLTLIQQIVLSRSLLTSIIEEFKLYQDVINSVGIENAIESMRKQIKVSIVGRGERVEAFSLGFIHENPMTAMKVTGKLASQFIEENLKMREQLVEGAAQFLTQELDKAKAALDEREKAISEFKVKHMGMLPEQLDGNHRKLDRLQPDLIATDDALRKLTERLAVLDKAVIDLQMIAADVSGYNTPSSGTTEGRNVQLGNDPLAARLRQLEQTLAALSGEYKDTYPDVIQVKQEIKKIKVQLEERQGELAARRATPIQGQQPDPNVKAAPVVTAHAEPSSETYLLGLITQREEVKNEVAQLKNRKRTLLGEIKQYESRIERTPSAQQELTMLLRDGENMQRNYQSLLEKNLNARMAENLEKRQKGEQFRIVDPANLPVKPTKPDPILVFLGGIVAGLGMAGGSVWWRDLRNLPFRRPEEIEAALEIPTLATIPHMSGLFGGAQSAEPEAGPSPKSRWARWVAFPKDLVSKWFDKAPLPSLKMRLFPEKRTPAAIQATRNALAAEQFRVLAGRIIQMREKKGVRVLAITSSLPGEGKSTLAIALAVTLARDYLEHTILMDGDMRNPSVSIRLGLGEEKGLLNVLAEECALEAALFQHAHPNLKVLTAGTSQVDRLGLPATRLQVQKLIGDLKHRGAFVILDAPPILPMADMNLYSEIVDSILLVVRFGQTPQHVVIEALDFLSGGNIEGAILNGAMEMGRTYYTNYATSRYSLLDKSSMVYLPGNGAHAGVPDETSVQDGRGK